MLAEVTNYWQNVPHARPLALSHLTRRTLPITMSLMKRQVDPETHHLQRALSNTASQAWNLGACTSITRSTAALIPFWITTCKLLIQLSICALNSCALSEIMLCTFTSSVSTFSLFETIQPIRDIWCKMKQYTDLLHYEPRLSNYPRSPG